MPSGVNNKSWSASTIKSSGLSTFVYILVLASLNLTPYCDANTILPVILPPAKGNFVLSVAVTPVILLPSPYNVSAYIFENLDAFDPMLYVESVPGNKFVLMCEVEPPIVNLGLPLCAPPIPIWTTPEELELVTYKLPLLPIIPYPLNLTLSVAGVGLPVPTEVDINVFGDVTVPAKVPLPELSTLNLFVLPFGLVALSVA